MVRRFKSMAWMDAKSWQPTSREIWRDVASIVIPCFFVGLGLAVFIIFLAWLAKV